jgi:mRNA interferase MazF
MVEEKSKEKTKEEILIRGGIYLARLDPVKATEIGKLRPVTILSIQSILDISPPVVFVCPLSSQSHPKFQGLHVELKPRDNLEVTSYALVEHCRAIAIKRFVYPRLAQLIPSEIALILNKLRRMVGI